MCELETGRQSTRVEVATDLWRLADQLETADTEAGRSVELELHRTHREVVA